MKPVYPIYVISKGRFDHCLTAKFLSKEKVEFKLVVETQEQDQYSSLFGKDRILVLPFSNLGLGSIPARNWVMEHSIKSDSKRHWILDDNMRCVYRRFKGDRVYCDSGSAFRAIEDFSDRYSNIGLSGMNYSMFGPQSIKLPPFFLNHRVYSCILVNNEIPYRWRGRYNEDTDLTLQVLSGNWCTLLFNAFMIDKIATMTMKGGNTAELYKGDGRLKMAWELKRRWPRVVSISRRFKRPQHVVDWSRFDTELIRKPGVKIPKTNEYGLVLTAS